MELVKQEKLHFKDSKSDKIYEVELYHIQSNEYVVNFRYGRRGGNLKEGTKTVFPVQKEKAEKVYADLVASKTKKGYQQVQSYDETIAQATPVEVATYEYSGARAVVLSYLNKKAKGALLNNNWRLSRIIWRAGELEIEEAIPAIKELLPSLQGQEVYSAVWTLGRLGSQEAIQLLHTIPLDPEGLHYRIQVGALIKAGDKSVREAMINSLPERIKALYSAQSYTGIKEILDHDLSLPKRTTDYLLTLYLLGMHDERLQQLVHATLVDIEAVPGKWRALRYIYKVAEMIKDGATFGLIARLANLRSSYYTKNKWSDKVWLNGKSIDRKEGLTSDEPQLAFSKSTREYFINRTLRRLRKAGVDKMESYCALAAGILTAYRENDAGRPYNMNFYRYDHESRNYVSTVRYYQAMSKVPYFYYILFAQGERMETPGKLKNYYCTADKAEWNSREDSFPELWDRYPQHAVTVLAHSKHRDVMNFGFMVLKDRTDLDSLLTFDSLLAMISNPFSEVLEFSLQYIQKKYDAQNPNEAVIFGLVSSENEAAIGHAVELLDKNKHPFIQNVDFIKLASLSKVERLHKWLRLNIKEELLNESDVGAIVDHCLSAFKNLEETIAHDFPQETLVQVFPNYLKKLAADKILELIDHPRLQVQLFGAKLLNLNERKPEEWPADVLMKLLSSQHEAIREEGMKLFSSLKDDQLLDKTDFIIQLASSEHQDLRLQARAVIERLTPKHKEFGEAVLLGLYDVLIDDHEEEDLPFDVYETIEKHLLPFTPILKPALDEMLVSNSREIHLLTYHIMEYENVNEWPVRQVAKLGAHDMQKIRDKAHKYFEENVEKVKYEKYEAINILDTDWEVTRSFGRAYFDQHFTEKEWDPDLVIALCDNVRPQTQDYGTRILGQYFKEEHGVQYLTKLSEHPDPIIELYSTNYLHKYAFNNQAVLDRLKPYFIRTLSAINTRRVAKQRVIHFLEKQSETSLAYAEYVAAILNELVGTIVVQENEHYVGLLHELKQKHPALDINIEKVPLEIR